MLTCLSENKPTLPSVTFFPRRVDARESHEYIMCVYVRACVCMHAIMSEDCARNPVILRD